MTKEKITMIDGNSAEKDIFKDLDRTFPNNTFFKQKRDLGQRSLFNVLSLFSRYQKETGYVQGMGFISATFLNYMNEEDAFWMLVTIMEKYELKSIYRPGFPELPRSFYKFMALLKKNYNRIYEIFVK